MQNIHFTALRRFVGLLALVLGTSIFSNAAWCNNLDYDVITPGVAGFGGFGLQLIGGSIQIQEWALQIPGATVPKDPNSTLPCDWPGPFEGVCYNDEYFYSASGVYLGPLPGGSNGSAGIFPGTGGVVIEDSNHDPLAIVWYGCGPEAVCDVNLDAPAGGGILDLSTTPLPVSAVNFPAIVAYGGPQDAIDVKFYDGTSAWLEE